MLGDISPLDKLFDQTQKVYYLYWVLFCAVKIYHDYGKFTEPYECIMEDHMKANSRQGGRVQAAAHTVPKP